MDAVMQALSDDNRRVILETLRRGPATVTELAADLTIARPGVSRHLRILREAGLVQVRKDAQRRIYAIEAAPLAELDDWLEPYRALWAGRLSALHTEVARGKRTTRQIAAAEVDGSLRGARAADREPPRARRRLAGAP